MECGDDDGPHHRAIDSVNGQSSVTRALSFLKRQCQKRYLLPLVNNGESRRVHVTVRELFIIKYSNCLTCKLHGRNSIKTFLLFTVLLL